MPQPKKIKRAIIHTIALCRRGKNKLPGFYKSESSDAIRFEPYLVKSNDDGLGDGLLTAVIYAPLLADSDNHFTDEDVIRDSAHNFLKEGGNLNIEHDGIALNKNVANVAESFIIQKGDPRFQDVRNSDGEIVDVTGGWGMVIQINDNRLKEKYASGDWNGVSMEGSGFFDKSESGLAEDLADRLNSNNNSDSEIDMTEKELEAAIAKGVEQGVKAVTEKKEEKTNVDPQIDPLALSLFPSDENKQKVAHAAIQLAKAKGKSGADLVAAAQEANAEPKSNEDEGAPVFKGDASKPEDLRAHAEKVRIYNAQKEIDFNDPEAVEAFAKSQEGETDDDGLTEQDRVMGIKKGDDKEVRELKRRLHKAQSRSSQVNDDNDDSDDYYAESGLSKSEIADLDNADEMIAYLNGDDEED